MCVSDGPILSASVIARLRLTLVDFNYIIPQTVRKTLQ